MTDVRTVDREEPLDEIWFEVQHLIRSQVRHAIRDGLPSPVGGAGLHILSHVMRTGPVSPSELADRLDIRSSTIAAHLDRLEEAGWLQRDAVPGAPSRVQVTVTEKGRDAYARFLELRRQVVERFLEPLPAADREALRHMLATALRQAREVHHHRRAGRHAHHTRSSEGGR